MYVKLKLETEGNSTLPLLLAIDDDATVYELKQLLEPSIGIPADLQQIYSLGKTIGDQCKLSAVLDYQVAEINGTAVSLYKMKEFVCFLQFQCYNQKKGEPETRNLTIEKEKRARLSKENLDLHRMRLVCDPVNTTIVPETEKATCSSGCIRNEPHGSYITQPGIAKDTAGVKDTAETVVACSAKKRLSEDDELIYAGVMPEKRKFVLVINETDSTSGFDSLMDHFHGLFGKFEDCDTLQFSESDSVNVFGNNLMIISEDKKTCEWIANGTSTIYPRYKCFSIIEFFGLIKCSFILPIVGKDKELGTIFKLFEQQNVGIVTDKWIVTDRTMLDPKSYDFDEKAASIILDNQEVVLYVDRESKTSISEQGFKLKYCFWRLQFTFF
ncbi:uncharacterized protein LOC108155615 [Drosophila miranda]|uniref:uncharacterized protein LOC108155615 n=1 Tax=Drosophila miranda TaxID=7229 RepID=UPI0007E87205|nr:uncharacterized protein LOC108155615 [Drosophila miranda]